MKIQRKITFKTAKYVILYRLKLKLTFNYHYPNREKVENFPLRFSTETKKPAHLFHFSTHQLSGSHTHKIKIDTYKAHKRFIYSGGQLKFPAAIFTRLVNTASAVAARALNQSGQKYSQIRTRAAAEFLRALPHLS